MTGTPTTIYNSTDGPLPYDRAGRVIPARERLRVPDAEASPVKGHVDAGRFVKVEAQDDDPVAPALEDAATDEDLEAVTAWVDESAAEASPPAARRRGSRAQTQED